MKYLSLRSALLLFCLLSVAMSATEQSRPLMGGYSPAQVADDGVVEAAAFATKALSEAQPNNYTFLSSVDGARVVVLKASTQVVAGMNYKLTIGLMDENGECQGAFKCTVYNRFGELSVTTWDDEVTCEEAKSLMEEQAEPES